MPQEKLPNKKMGPREIARFFHQDGVFEIVAGAVLLNFGLDVYNQSDTTSLFAYLPIVVYNSIKNQVFFARIDLKEFGIEGKKARMWSLSVLIGLIVALVAMSMLVLTNMVEEFPLPEFLYEGNLQALTAGVVIAVACIVAAMAIPLDRFLIYAGVAVVLGVASFFFLPAYVPVFGSAVAMLAWGINLTVKFRKAFPLPEKEENL